MMRAHLRRVVVPTAGLLMAVGLGAAGSSPPPPNTGTATTVIALPHLTLTMPDGSQVSVDLGALTSAAATESAPVASLSLLNAAIAGNPASAWSVDTTSGDQASDHTITLPGGTPAIGQLQLSGYSVSTTPSSATSALQALTASMSANGLGGTVGLGQHGISSLVDGQHSASDLTLTATGVSLTLGDILPAPVLNALPLSELVAIAQGLGLPVAAGASNVGTQLDDTTTTLQQTTSDAALLSQAQADLAALLLAIPSTATEQQQLDQAQQQLTDATNALNAAETQLAVDVAAEQVAQTQLDAANAAVTAAQTQLSQDQATLAALLVQFPPATLAQIDAAQAAVTQDLTNLSAAQAAATAAQNTLDAAQATVTADQATVATAQQNVSDAQAAVDTAQAALDAAVAAVAAANAAVAAAQAAVDNLTSVVSADLTLLSSQVSSLPDLTALRQTLLDEVTGAALVDLGTTGLTISAAADDNGGVGTVSCTLSAVTVGGNTLPGGACDQVVASFGQAATQLQSMLDTLPVATPAALPQLDGLLPSTAGAAALPTDTVTSASAGISGLHLSLPAVDLAPVADTAVTGVQSALGPAQTAIAALGLPALNTSAAPSLSALTLATSGLPTGAGLAGLRTIGLDTSVAGVQASVVHNRSLPTPAGAGGGGGGAGGGGTPPAPTPTPSVSPSVSPSVVPSPTGSPVANPPAPASGPSAGTSGPPATTPAPTGGAVPGPTGAPPSSADPPADPPGDQPPVKRPVVDHSPLPGLPFTGADSALELGFAMIVLLVGAQLSAVRRRRAPAPVRVRSTYLENGTWGHIISGDAPPSPDPACDVHSRPHLCRLRRCHRGR